VPINDCREFAFDAAAMVVVIKSLQRMALAVGVGEVAPTGVRFDPGASEVTLLYGNGGPVIPVQPGPLSGISSPNAIVLKEVHWIAPELSLPRVPLFDHDVQPHLGMDAAQHHELSWGGEHNIGLGPRLLVTRIKTEGLRIYVCMMDEFAVIIEDLDRLPTMDGQKAWIKFLAFLGDQIWLSRGSRQQRNCIHKTQNRYRHCRLPDATIHRDRGSGVRGMNRRCEGGQPDCPSP
jgi:hypothetical protein